MKNLLKILKFLIDSLDDRNYKLNLKKDFLKSNVIEIITWIGDNYGLLLKVILYI